MRLRLALAALLLTALAVACGKPAVRLAEGPREYVPDDYPQVLRLWTREEQLIPFEELDNVLTATATFESWDFRWAYVIRYADDYRLTLDQRRALLERSLAESRRYHQFFVGLYAQVWRWGDLTADEPAWIVRLVDDRGNETAPAEIQKIRRPGAIELTYFPYIRGWRRAFRVRFPTRRSDGTPTISPDADWFGLRFAGPQGNKEMRWYTRPDGAPDDEPPAGADATVAAAP